MDKDKINKAAIKLRQRYDGKAINDGITSFFKRARNLYNTGSVKDPNSGGYDGGSFSGGGAGSKILDQSTPIENDEWRVMPIERTFNEAFADAHRNGDSEFWFNGKLYKVEFGDNPENWKAGQKRKEIIALPYIKKKEQSEKDALINAVLGKPFQK